MALRRTAPRSTSPARATAAAWRGVRHSARGRSSTSDVIRLEDWQPRVLHGTAWLRLLDKLDERVLEHRFYGFCTCLARHPSWRPTSAAHPRPGGRPSYIAPNCPTCGTPLVLWD